MSTTSPILPAVAPESALPASPVRSAEAVLTAHPRGRARGASGGARKIAAHAHPAAGAARGCCAGLRNWRCRLARSV